MNKTAAAAALALGLLLVALALVPGNDAATFAAIVGGGLIGAALLALAAGRRS